MGNTKNHNKIENTKYLRYLYLFAKHHFVVYKVGVPIL